MTRQTIEMKKKCFSAILSKKCKHLAAKAVLLTQGNLLFYGRNEQVLKTFFGSTSKQSFPRCFVISTFFFYLMSYNCLMQERSLCICTVVRNGILLLPLRCFFYNKWPHPWDGLANRFHCVFKRALWLWMCMHA